MQIHQNVGGSSGLTKKYLFISEPREQRREHMRKICPHGLVTREVHTHAKAEHTRGRATQSHLRPLQVAAKMSGPDSPWHHCNSVKPWTSNRGPGVRLGAGDQPLQ